MTVKYGWSPEVYISKVEGNSDARFKDYMQAEIRYISNIPRIVTKTIVDLGAGYGRVEGVLSGIAREVKAIEIDKVMLKALRDRTKNFDNVRVISGDVNSLSSFVTGTDLVLISLQNSLGTWIGDRDIAIKQIRKVLELSRGEIVISLLNQESLKDWGVDAIYAKIPEMVGEIDFGKTDFDQGLFVSKTGYLSKWWNREEVIEISKSIGGTLVAQITTPCYHIIHNSYAEYVTK